MRVLSYPLQLGVGVPWPPFFILSSLLSRAWRHSFHTTETELNRSNNASSVLARRESGDLNTSPRRRYLETPPQIAHTRVPPSDSLTRKSDQCQKALPNQTQRFSANCRIGHVVRPLTPTTQHQTRHATVLAVLRQAFHLTQRSAEAAPPPRTASGHLSTTSRLIPARSAPRIPNNTPSLYSKRGHYCFRLTIRRE